jgi:chemotaxis protein MotA
MFVIIGYLLIVGSVLGGFALAGGHLHVLFQPVELLVIGGAAVGAFVVGNPSKTLKATAKAIPTLFKGSKYTKDLYMQLMGLMYEILTKVRKEGLMSIEGDIEDVDSSPLFSKYPDIVADHHLTEFLTDYLRLIVSGNLNPMEIENLMDNEIDTHHHEGEIPAHAIQKIGDGLPAFGIVAAVLGVVNTMGSVGLPPSELGNLIAAPWSAPSGILRFHGRAASSAEQRAASHKELQCVKVTLLASLNGYAPPLALEFGRKVLYSTDRPTFAELEQHVKKHKGR